jgi:chromosome segregation ATPase
MTNHPPNNHRTRHQQMMPNSNRPAEHARHVFERVIRGVSIPTSVYRPLSTLINGLEAAKSELKGHLSDRKAEIQQLRGELEQARELQSDHGLVQLYNAGTALISKQVDELNNLKSEFQRGKDKRDRLVLKLAENDNQLSKVQDEKKNCHEAVRRLEDRLAGMALGSPDVQADSSQELVVLKQRLGDSHKKVDDQQRQRQINSLRQENGRLLMALGRQHFNELDLP